MKRLFATLLIFCFLLCGCSRIALLPQEDANLQQTYTKACDLLKEGKLEEAYPLFLRLGDYKDSAVHASKFTYLPIEILAEDDGFGEEIVEYKTTYSYDDMGHLLEGKGAYTNDEGPGYSEKHTYKDGLLIKSQLSSEAGESTITYKYNDQGQCLKEVGFTDGANVGGITTFSYDEKGLLVRANVASYMGIDAANYEQQEPYHTFQKDYTYNKQGLCTKAEEDLGETGIFTYAVEYNSFDLPTRFIAIDNDGFESVTLFEYDQQGRCTKVDTDYDITEFTYGKGNNPTSAIRTRDGGKPCDMTYTYQLFYLEEQPQIPFFLEEYLSGLEV